MEQDKKHIVDVLFVLALFGVFTVSALVLVIIGADVYQHTVQDMTANFESRTAVAYVTEKIRQNDTFGSDAVCITELGGQPALTLTQTYYDVEYCTYLYFYDGSLCELFTQKNNSLGANILKAGQPILALNAFEPEEISNGLIRVSLETQSGQTRQLYLSTHSSTD